MNKHFFAMLTMCLAIPLALLFTACNDSRNNNSEATITDYSVTINEGGAFAQYDLNKTGELTFEDVNQYDTAVKKISSINDFIVLAAYSDGSTKKLTNWRVQKASDSYDLNIIHNNQVIATIHVVIQNSSTE